MSEYPKMRKAKKVCDGYVAVSPEGKFLCQTFVSRPGNSKMTGAGKPWTLLIKHLGYPHTTLEQRKKYTKQLVAEGWRIVAVNLRQVTEEDLVESGPPLS